MFLCAWKSCSFQENETTTFYFFMGEVLGEEKVFSRFILF